MKKLHKSDVVEADGELHTSQLADFVARVCHNVNTAYSVAIGQLPTALPATQEQMQSTLAGILYRLRNPNGPPEDQHNAWMTSKLADGWVYGPEKNAEAKTHPCLVPYAELPEAERVKDALFIAVVDSFLS